MPLKIKQDHSRFREIIRGRIKNNLRKYIQKGEMIGKKGKDLITIPVPSIDIPHFRYGHKDQGGVGQGDGEPGTVLAPGAVEGDGHGKAELRHMSGELRHGLLHRDALGDRLPYAAHAQVADRDLGACPDQHGHVRLQARAI